MTKFQRKTRLPAILRCGAGFIRRIRPCLLDRAGAVAVEFVFLFPIFLMFIFGTLEFGRYMWSEHALDYAAEQASRYALANPSAPLAEIQTYAEEQLVTLNSNDVTVTVANETLDGVDYLKVTVTHPFETILPIVPFGPFTLTRVSRYPVPS